MNILITDDDASDRKMLVRNILKSGASCQIVEVAGVEAALAACEATRFDCLIIDYHMPGADGLHAIDALKLKAANAAVIMVTGHGDETIAAEAIKRGAHEYIAKRSITPDSIRHAIEVSLDKAALHRKIDSQRDAIGNFAHVLAHDLFGPIRTVRGLAELIIEDVQNGQTQDLVESCQRLLRSALLAETLVRTLRSYTKLDQPVEFAPVSMSQIVEDALTCLETEVAEKDASIACDPLPIVFGNRPQLAQLLQNLIANALKFCRADAPSVRIGAEETERGWRISVTDNGIGIPEKFREDIFKPFRQLHRRDEYAGAGLGLATCAKIIERHGGSIWCESEEGRGSTFFFVIPQLIPATQAVA